MYMNNGAWTTRPNDPDDDPIGVDVESEPTIPTDGIDGTAARLDVRM
ncbi:hypothetical protein ACERIT_07830 [Halopenitus sp. H-Gu1]